MTTPSIKSTPYSKESEMMVLGCMLTHVNSLNLAIDKLYASDFYFSEHRTIFQTLAELYKQDKPADLHLLCEELKRKDKLKSVGGVSYITEVVQYAGTAAHIEHYTDLVKKKSILRQMIEAASSIEKKAFEQPDDVHEALDEAQQLFFKISQSHGSNTGLLLSDFLSGLTPQATSPYLTEIEKRQEDFKNNPNKHKGVTGTPSGFMDLDKIINGLGKSNLLILAGRPGMGKTAFALNIAEYVCFKENIPVGIFSLEMSAEQLIHRVICCQSEVESQKILTGSLDGMDYQSIVASVNMMSKHTLIIDDQPGLKVTDLRARARRMKEAHNIGLLIIDYLQLLSGSGSNKSIESRQNEISEISRMLKNLARELDLPIICGSQLSRRVEERTGHRPMMSDLRESGSIEQDADVIMFLLRREYYDPMDKPGMAEVIVAKNRHGSVGSTHLTFRKELGQFKNYTPEDID